MLRALRMMATTTTKTAAARCALTAARTQAAVHSPSATTSAPRTGRTGRTGRRARRRSLSPSAAAAAAVASASSSSAGSAGATLLYYPRHAHARKWAEAIHEAAAPTGGLEMYVFDTEDSRANKDIPWDSIGFAIVWKPPAGLLDKCSNLKAVQLTGAGVDAVLAGKLVPLSLPLARIVDPVMAQSMATYVLCAVLNLHRRTDDYMEAQRRREWGALLVYEEKVLPAEMRVGFLGLGEMAAQPAQMLRGVGYQVSGWTRSRAREVEGVEVYTGPDQLGRFLASLDVLVCLLPLTPSTRGFVDAEVLHSLPKGASIINVGRGAHVVVEDLISALDSGQISRAVLDVFDQEPLPTDSPLWDHPRVRLTPHVSAKTNIDTSVPQILENRRRALAGELPLLNQVDVQAGY